MTKYLRLILALVLTVSPLGCGGSGPTAPSPKPTDSGAPPPPTTGKLVYVIQDIWHDFVPVAGARVTVGAVEVITGDDGVATFSDARIGDRVSIAAPKAVTHQGVVKSLGRIIFPIMPGEPEMPSPFIYEMLYDNDRTGGIFQALNRTACYKLLPGLDDDLTVQVWQTAAQTLNADGNGLVKFAAGNSALVCDGAEYRVFLGSQATVGGYAQMGTMVIRPNSLIIERASIEFASLENARRLNIVLHFMMRALVFYWTPQFSGGVMSYGNVDDLTDRERFVLLLAYSREQGTRFPDTTP